MQFYIYIIYSSSANEYYVGHSNNPWERVNQHNANPLEKYTGKYIDWALQATFFVSENRSDALRLEKFIKKQKSRSLLEKLIDPNFIPNGILAQLVRVPHVRD